MKYLNFFYCLVLLSLMPSNTYSCSWETFKFACESCFCCDLCCDSSDAENIKIRRREERATIALNRERAAMSAAMRARAIIPAARARDADSLVALPALSARSSLASVISIDSAPVVPANSPEIAINVILGEFLNSELVHHQDRQRQDDPMRSPNSLTIDSADSLALRSPNSLTLRSLDALALRSNSASYELNSYVRRTSRTVDGDAEMLNSGIILNSDHQEYSESGIIEMRSRPSFDPLPFDHLPHAVADDNLQG
jgi:hypothetical protein